MCIGYDEHGPLSAWGIVSIGHDGHGLNGCRTMWPVGDEHETY